MHYHLYNYGKQNEKELSKILEGALQKCNLNFKTYLDKMYYCTTCGYEITLLFLSKMYNVDIIVIRPDFVWLSRAVAPITCGIVLVQDSSGSFLGTKTKNPVYIGLVPKISLPDPNVIRGKLHELTQQSTPIRPMEQNHKAFRKFGGGLSPIVEKTDRKSLPNKEVVARQDRLGEQSSSSSSASTSILRCKIQEFEETNLSQTTDGKEDENELTTTYDPNEISAEDGQRNDIETSHDQEQTETSVTKEESEEMSETLDVGETDRSTLDENNSKEDNETSTITGEDDKMVTADVIGYNDDNVQKENNAVGQNNEDDIDGEDQNEIERTTKQSNDLGQTNETDNTDEKQNDVDDAKIISKVNKSASELQTSNVNTRSNEKGDNSDDIIPSASMTDSNIEIGKPEERNLCAGNKIVETTGTDATDITVNEQKKDDGKHAEKHRLGMGGPAFMRRTLKVKMQDISIDSDKSVPTAVTENLKEGNKSVMRKLMCTKCPEMFFTTKGYQRHLFKDHKIRCFDKHPPQVIEKMVMTFSEETYEMNYRVVKTKNPDTNKNIIEDSDQTCTETDMAQEAHGMNELAGNLNVQSMQNDESNEGIDISSDGKLSKQGKRRRRKGSKSQLTRRKKRTVSATVQKKDSASLEKLKAAMYKAYSISQDKPTVKCLGCDTYFFAVDGMRTHFKNAHTNLNYEEVAANNESKRDETFNNESQVETENDGSHDIERATLPHLEETEQSELPDIVPPTQNITHGRKRTRNDTDSNLLNKKRSKQSPSAPKTRGQDHYDTVKDNYVGTKIISEAKVGKKISEVSDETNAISTHVTRSQTTSTHGYDENVPHQSIAKSSTKTSKPVGFMQSCPRWLPLV